MASAVEYKDYVQSVFEELSESHGYVHPSIAGSVLAGFDERLSSRIERTLYRHETKPFLYDGASKTILSLLQSGDHVGIWTDDYVVRLGTAGFSELRRALPHSERKRLFASAGEDKFAKISDLVAYAKDNNLQRLVFVDNRIGNLQKAHDAIDAEGPRSLSASYVLTLQSPIEHIGESDRSLPGTVIKTITELSDYRDMIFDGVAQHQVLWAIDFNHTLINTQALEQSRIEKIAEILHATTIIDLSSYRSPQHMVPVAA